jgi:cysteinyl-tRNA synthetase
MSHAIHGDQIDIHGGGMDLIFPHHENEIAQTEGFTGQVFAKYWLHNNMLNFSGQKMSKSLGNVRTLRDFLAHYHPEIFKFLILSAHYRSVSDFSEVSIHNAIGGLARVYSALVTAEGYVVAEGRATTPAAPTEFAREITKAWDKITESLNDDFNSAEVLAHIFEVVRGFNVQVKKGLKVNPTLAAKSREFVSFVHEVGKLMAIFQENAAAFQVELDDLLLKKLNLERATVEALVQERVQARSGKDFKKSDELRDKLVAMGIAIYDSAQGTEWEVQK